MSNGGVKHDGEKPQMALLSPFALEQMAAVMTFGAKKYSADNWRGGFKYSRILSAVLRHITAYQRGEAKDPETGLSHLAHASCGLMMLLEFEQTGAGQNDIYWQNTSKTESNVEPASTSPLKEYKTHRVALNGGYHLIELPVEFEPIVNKDGTIGVKRANSSLKIESSGQ